MSATRDYPKLNAARNTQRRRLQSTPWTSRVRCHLKWLRLPYSGLVANWEETHVFVTIAWHHDGLVGPERPSFGAGIHTTRTTHATGTLQASYQVYRLSLLADISYIHIAPSIISTGSGPDICRRLRDGGLGSRSIVDVFIGTVFSPNLERPPSLELPCNRPTGFKQLESPHKTTAQA